MSSVLPLTTTSSLVIVRTLLDLEDKHSLECRSKAFKLKRQMLCQKSNLVILEKVLKQFVQDFPQLLKIDILKVLVPEHLKVLNLKNCSQILNAENLTKYLEIISSLQYIHTIIHDNGCSSEEPLPSYVAESWGQRLPNLWSVSVEDVAGVNDSFVQTLLRSAPNLTSLNVSLCRGITDDIFKISHDELSIKHQKKNMEKCKLDTLDLSGCRSLTSTCIRHLTELCGETLLHLNVACTSMDCTILWYLSGYSLSSVLHLAASLNDHQLREIDSTNLFSLLKVYEKLKQEMDDMNNQKSDAASMVLTKCEGTSRDTAEDMTVEDLSTKETAASSSQGDAMNEYYEGNVHESEENVSTEEKKIRGFPISAQMESSDEVRGEIVHHDLENIAKGGNSRETAESSCSDGGDIYRPGELEEVRLENTPKGKSTSGNPLKKKGSLIVHTVGPDGVVIDEVSEETLDAAADELVLTSLLRSQLLLCEEDSLLSNPGDEISPDDGIVANRKVERELNCESVGKILGNASDLSTVFNDGYECTGTQFISGDDAENEPKEVFESRTTDEGVKKEILLPKVYQPQLISLNISGLTFDETLVAHCFKEFFYTNKKLKQIVLPCAVMSDELLEIVAERAENFTNLNLFDCERVTNSGVGHILGQCRNLRIFDIQANHFISDEAFMPLIEHCGDCPVSILRLTEISITDHMLQTIVHCWGATLKEINLGWCEEVTSDGVCLIADNCPLLEVFDIRKCELSENAFLSLARNCPRIRSLELCDVETLTDNIMAEMVKHLKNLKELNIGWNLNLTDFAVKAILSSCPLISDLNLVGLKRLTEKPFVSIISDYPRWFRCQSFIKLKIKEKQLRRTGEPQLSSDEEYEELYVPVRSTSYAPMLRHLNLEFCDLMNDRMLAEIVAICCGNLTIIDYYGMEVVPKLLSLK